MHCKECGTKLEKNAKFCPSCGKAIEIVKTNKSTNGNTLNKVVSIVVFILAIGVGKYVTQEFFSGPDYSKTENKQLLIAEEVKAAKKMLVLPKEIDEYTTLTSVTEKTGAIRYSYLLHDFDTTQITSDDLKSNTVEGACASKDVTNLLNRDIRLEYEYKVDSSTDTFFYTISKVDCIN